MTITELIIIIAFGLMLTLNIYAAEERIKAKDWPKAAHSSLLAFWWMGCLLTYWSKLP